MCSVSPQAGSELCCGQAVPQLTASLGSTPWVLLLINAQQNSQGNRAALAELFSKESLLKSSSHGVSSAGAEFCRSRCWEPLVWWGCACAGSAVGPSSSGLP